jgi:hypothetical protein
MAIALETVMPEWRDPEFGHRLVLLRRAERQSPGRPLVVVLGTSRTQNAIYPGAMGFPDVPGTPRVFNFGQSGASPLKQLLALQRLLDEGVKPAAVVVELFPANLAPAGSAEAQFAGWELRLSAADLGHLAPYRAEALRPAWLKARANPWHAQRQVLMNHWLPKWQPWPERFDHQWSALDADGFLPVGEMPAQTRARAWGRAREEYAGAFTAFSAAGVSVRAVRELVALCRAEGIAVAFFVPPVSPAFRESFAPGVFSQGEAAVANLARLLGVAVFPALRDLGEEAFLDGHHLLCSGAERYSRWLAENHLRRWLAECGMGGAP